MQWPLSAVEDKYYKITFDPSVPKWVQKHAKIQLLDSFGQYRKNFSIPVSRPVPVYVDYIENGLVNNGAVTSGYGMTLMLRGPIWKEKNSLRSQRLLTKLIWHEGFHIWHIFYFPKVDRGVNSFLLEGAADYFHWKKFTASFDKSAGIVPKEMIVWLNGCARSLQGRSLIDIANMSSAKANYLCGIFIQWMIDEWLDKATKGKENITTLWRDLFAASRVQNFSNQLLLDNVFTYLSQKTKDPKYSNILKEMIYGVGEERWSHFSNHLQDSGIPLRLKKISEYGSDVLIELIVRNLIQDECAQKTPWIWTNQGITSLNNKGCKVLGNIRKIETINGVKIPDDSYEAFLLIKSACKKDKVVRLGRQLFKADIKFACKTELKNPPVQFKLIDNTKGHQ